MSLERKDVRTKLDDPYHKALSGLADADRIEISEWVERLIVREIDRIAHESRLKAEATAHLGKSGNNRDGQGSDANRR
jgi:hypothetical protein